MHPYYHALSSVKKWGGKPEDYQPIHDFFDSSKRSIPDFRHRALYHHSEGIFLCEKLFGTTITNADGRVVPVRQVGEQHVKEDCGFIPTAKDWWGQLKVQPWMLRVAVKPEDVASGTDPAAAEVAGAAAVLPDPDDHGDYHLPGGFVVAPSQLAPGKYVVVRPDGHILCAAGSASDAVDEPRYLDSLEEAAAVALTCSGEESVVSSAPSVPGRSPGTSSPTTAVSSLESLL